MRPMIGGCGSDAVQCGGYVVWQEMFSPLYHDPIELRGA
jgi:hypothetical protein